MAKVIKSFKFRRSGTPVSFYPWDQWLDGRCWELEAGKDYTVSTDSIRVCDQ